MKMTAIRIAGLGFAAAACAFASAATDTAPMLSFNMTIGQTSASWTDAAGTIKAPDSTIWNYAGKAWTGNGSLAYIMQADPDPILGFDFSFFNDTGATQTFNVLVTLPVTPWAMGTLMGASIGASVTDTSGNGSAMMSSAGGTPVFRAYTDYVPAAAAAMSLFDSPFDLSVGIAGGTSIDSDMAGLPLGLPGPMSVTTNIAIELNFDLTAGDRASFTGAFIVEYVPTPAGALAFLGLGFLGRRRR